MQNSINQKPLSIMLAQINVIVGDIAGNLQLIIDAIANAKAANVDCIVFPELTLTGYPPEDMLTRDDFLTACERALLSLSQYTTNITAIVGHPKRYAGQLFNCASVFQDGKIIHDYAKRCLPNYGVFDEKRYFKTGSAPLVFQVNNHKIGLLICEDLWHENPINDTKAQGAELIISINASPFHIYKATQRLDVIKEKARKHNTAIVYVHLIGGQDELVFDGGSKVVAADGSVCLLSPYFKSSLDIIEFTQTEQGLAPIVHHQSPAITVEKLIYDALVTGVRDYIHKNNFSDVIIGLSGGIDSALTTAIAVDALGASQVHAIMMPSRFTSQISLEDASNMAKMLNISYQEISIEPVFEAALNHVSPFFPNQQQDVTQENMQSRIRALILMALSNKLNALVLTTGNKSEMAVGYATLYGDMVGAFAPLKDVYKTWVYKLAVYRNQQSPMIPERIITRPPSAELRENQTDADSLPPYEILDEILRLYVEDDLSLTAIAKRGYAKETVRQIIALVDRNEFKRRQAAPGVRITPRAFGRNRRYPITNRFRPDLID